MLAAMTTGIILIPVRVTRMTLVLTGVLVMPTLVAAIVATITAAVGAFGSNSVAAVPIAAPMNMSGKINPPRNPVLKVTLTAKILTAASSTSSPTAALSE